MQKNLVQSLDERISTISDAIAWGATQEQIGNLLGVCRERVRQLLAQYTMYESWKEGRVYRKRATPQLRSNLLRILEKRADDVAREQGFPWEQARKYVQLSKKKSSRSIQQYVDFLTVYQQAAADGEKLSFVELERRCDLTSMTMHRMLKTLRLPNLTGITIVITKIPAWKKKAIAEAYERFPCISAVDIAYFLDVGAKNVQRMYKEFGGNRYMRFSYRQADMILEATAAGFTREETREYAGVKQIKVDRVLEQKELLEHQLKEIKSFFLQFDPAESSID